MIVFMFIIYVGTQVVSNLKDSVPTKGVLKYYELMEMIRNDEVEIVDITKGQPTATVKLKNGDAYDIVNPQSDTFIEDIMKAGALVSYRKTTLSDSIMGVLLALPLAILLAMFTVYIAQTTLGANTKMFTLLKSKDNQTSFDDIRGITETKNEVMFLVQSLKQWKKLGELGARPVKGVLFYGPPGTGKTLLAKAIANEAGVPFVSASGSDFNEVFVGTGARRIRDLWDLAASNAPCILFIDEIDCIGKRRRGDGAAMENNQTINALLQRMDGLNNTPGVLVIAATNDKDALDEALLRSGRFDREFFVGPPTNKSDRDSVVELYIENKKLAEDVTLEKASKLLCGLTAADIDETLNEAVYISLMQGRDGVIKLSDIDEASMKIRLSGVKKEHSSTRDEEVTAVHEAAHALMGLLLERPILKTSIVAYSSGTGGVTIKDTDTTGDTKLRLKSEMEEDIMVLLAGKCGEDIVYGEHTQGCGNDIAVATEKVYEMIVCYGNSNQSLMNQAIMVEKGYLNHVQSSVLDTCNKVLQDLNEQVFNRLSENKDRLLKLKNELLREKTLVNPTLESIDQMQGD